MIIEENIVPQLKLLTGHSEPRLRKVAAEAVGRYVAARAENEPMTWGS